MAVVLYTDTHYTRESGFAPSFIVKKLADLINPLYVIHLGDLAHWATEDKETALTLWQEHNVIMREIKSPYYQVVGNHDDGCVYNNDVLHNKNAELYAKAEDLFFATTEGDKKSIDNIGSRHGWYYVDDETAHIRSVILNSHDYPWVLNGDGTLKYDSRQNVGISACYSASQIDWFANKALDLREKENPSEWAFVVYAHMGTANWANINILLKAVKNGTDIRRSGLPYPCPSELTEEWDAAYKSVNLTVDYSVYGGLPVAFILGDRHEDVVDTSQGYSRITVLNASLAKDQSSAPVKTKGTPTETAIDILVLDSKAKKITELRFGAGRATGYNPLTDYDNYRIFNW